MDSKEFDRLLRLDAEAVRDSAGFAAQAGPGDLSRPTPCDGWDLRRLLAHMTAQHRGFAAAARGRGGEAGVWAEWPTASDPVADHLTAAEDVTAAFAELSGPQQALALPQLAQDGQFPAALAVGFHLVDYLVHGWDVARSLGRDYDPGDELLEAGLAVALAVPRGQARLAAGSAFKPELDPAPGAGPLDRTLALLGRRPDWTPAC
ncbi:TIGR03086 family metal-binding protein [Streptacidiphilus monticola]|uniref:TIGR03086 family metal-binding protein n=1 Tax=Streptacidiphilus monticola TaxID=2161674 RepID=A0ABW1G2W0_9ACTN